MTTTAHAVTTASGFDYKVADLQLAEWGRKEIRLAEQEMPGLMVDARGVRGADSRSAGLRVMGSLHMTIQTAVLIETLRDLGADVRWAPATSSPPRTTPRRRSSSAPTAPPDAPKGVPVFAWKGETLEEYWGAPSGRSTSATGRART